MKALSLTQPWATAMAIGLKEWETRSWPTSFRGRMAIHAAKGFPGWAKEFAAEAHRYHSGFPREVSEFPLGAVVCVGEIVECRRTNELRGDLSQTEQAWGDYADGRFAFKFNLERMLWPSIPAKGALGFWKMTDELGTAVTDQLVR